MDEESQKILKTEYSTSFDEHRKKAIINSCYRYGPVRRYIVASMPYQRRSRL